MKRADILRTAEKCVCGQREQDYGKPENNFQAIADLWNAYLNNAKVYDIEKTQLEDKSMNLGPLDVAVMMTLFKIGRITSGTATDDSFVDACGYLACGGEIVEKSRPWQENLKKVLAEAEKCKADIDLDNRYPSSGSKQY